MMWAGAILTALHALLAFTPLYDLVIVRLLSPPAEIVEPARLGLRIMLPWTWAIAYRRFNQGLLIRFDRAPDVTIGTSVRLASVAVAVAGALAVRGLPGIAVATIGVGAGVLAEALYIGLRVRPVIRGPLAQLSAVSPALSWRAFYAFYVPLALTSLLLLLVQSLGSAAIGRMPRALESLATWPVLMGLLFILRSLGFAYNEVVVSLMDRPGAPQALRRFTTLLAAGTLLVMVLIAATPVAELWFRTISGLDAEVAELARQGLWLGLLWPALDVIRNYFQGTIVYGRQTRGVTESVVVYLVVSGALLLAGVARQSFTGLEVGLVAFMAGTGAQIGWLWWRSRPILRRDRQARHRAHRLAFAEGGGEGVNVLKNMIRPDLAHLEVVETRYPRQHQYGPQARRAAAGDVGGEAVADHSGGRGAAAETLEGLLKQVAMGLADDDRLAVARCLEERHHRTGTRQQADLAGKGWVVVGGDEVSALAQQQAGHGQRLVDERLAGQPHHHCLGARTRPDGLGRDDLEAALAHSAPQTLLTHHEHPGRFWVAAPQVASGGFRGGEDALRVQRHPEAGQLVGVLAGNPGSVVGGQHVAEAAGVERSEKVCEARHRGVAVPQHAVHIEDEAVDAHHGR